ncbi:MAG TPA: cytochrome c oxidase assembly protein [Thermoanaerobaculia bacterium]|nr:cytochrome c oxidase assembly protein [Thermoanaerobaculia bacterium]
MRRALLILGALILAAVWLGPLPRLAQTAFFAHMSMHMAVVAVAAPLLALGIAGGRLDPVRRAPGLFAAVPASVLELLVVWAWHAPVPHHLARQSAVGMAAEQGMFLAAGLLLWLSAFGGDSPRSGNRTAAGVVGLLLTSMHMTLLGALLALAPRPVYAHGFPHPEGGLFGLTPLEDQQLGGAIMLLVGGISYLVGGLSLMVGLLKGGALAPGGRA